MATTGSVEPGGDLHRFADVRSRCPDGRRAGARCRSRRGSAAPSRRPASRPGATLPLAIAWPTSPSLAPERHSSVGHRLGGQPLAADLGPAAVLVLHVGPGQQLAELAVALAVLADQQHAGGLVPIDLVGDPGVRADDRLDALAAGALVELDHPEQVGQIGDAQGRHAVGDGAGNGGIHLHDPVGDRVLGVEAQVDEAGGVGSVGFQTSRDPPPTGVRFTPLAGFQGGTDQRPELRTCALERRRPADGSEAESVSAWACKALA